MSNGIVIFGGPPNTAGVLEGNEGTYSLSFPYSFTTEDVRDVAFDGEKLVGVGKPYVLMAEENVNGVGVMLSHVPSGNTTWEQTATYYRANGLEAWTPTNEANPDAGGYGIACDGRVWVAVGQGFGDDIRQSYNGLDWYTVSGGNFGIRGNKVATNGSAWVAVGKTTSEVNTTILVNSVDDGWTWSKPEGSQFRTEGTDIAWNGARWLAVGGSSILTSRDPKAATWLWIDFPYKGDSLKSVAWTGDKWVVLGISSVYESSNAINWVQNTDPTVVAAAETITTWKNVRSTKILPNTKNAVQLKTFSDVTGLLGANVLVFGDGPYGTVLAANVSGTSQPTWTPLSGSFFTASQNDSNYWGPGESRFLYDQTITSMISDPVTPGRWIIAGNLSITPREGDPPERFSIARLVPVEDSPDWYFLRGEVSTASMAFCRKLIVADALINPGMGDEGARHPVGVAVGDGPIEILYNTGLSQGNWKPYIMQRRISDGVYEDVSFSSARDVTYDGRTFFAVGTHPTGAIARSPDGWKWATVDGFLSTGMGIANNGRYTMVAGFTEGDIPEAVTQKVLLNICDTIWIPFQDGLYSGGGDIATTIAGSSKGWVLGRKSQRLGLQHTGDSVNASEGNTYTEEQTTLYTVEDFDLPTRWKRAGYRGQYISQSGEYIRKNVLLKGATFLSVSVTVDEYDVSQYVTYTAVDVPVTSIQYAGDRWFATGNSVLQSFDGEVWEPCPFSVSSTPGFTRTFGMWATPETVSREKGTVQQYYSEMVAYTNTLSQDVSAAIWLIVNPVSGYHINTQLGNLLRIGVAYNYNFAPAFLSMSDAYGSVTENQNIRSRYLGLPESVSGLEVAEANIRLFLSSINSESNSLSLASNARINLFNSVSATTAVYRSNVDRYLLSVNSYITSVSTLDPSNVNGFTNLPIPRVPFEPTTISSNRFQLLSLTDRIQNFVNSFPRCESNIYAYLDTLDKQYADFSNYHTQLLSPEANISTAYDVFTDGFSNLSVLYSMISNEYFPALQFYSNVNAYVKLFEERSIARKATETDSRIYDSTWYAGIVSNVTENTISSLNTTLSTLSAYSGTLDTRAIQFLSDVTKTFVVTHATNLSGFYPQSVSQYETLSEQYYQISQTISLITIDRNWRLSKLSNMNLSRSYYQGLLDTLSTKRSYAVTLLSQNLSAIQDLSTVNGLIQSATLSARSGTERIQQAGVQFYDRLRSNAEAERLAYLSNVQAEREAAALAEQATISQKRAAAEADAAADASNQLKVLYRDALMDIENLLGPMSSNFSTLLPASRQLVSLTLSYTSTISSYFPTLSAYLVSSQSLLTDVNTAVYSSDVLPYLNLFRPIYVNATANFRNMRDFSNLIYYDTLDNLRNDNQFEVSNTHGDSGLFISSVSAYVLSSTYNAYESTRLTTGYQSELLQQINDATNYRNTLCAYSFYTNFLSEGGTLPPDAPNGAALISLAYTTLSELNNNLATVSACISANNAIVDTAFSYNLEIESAQNRVYERYNTLKISEETAERERLEALYAVTVPAKVSDVNTAIELMAKTYLLTNAAERDRFHYSIFLPPTYRSLGNSYFKALNGLADNATIIYETIRATPITDRTYVDSNRLALQDYAFTLSYMYSRFYNLPPEADLSTLLLSSIAIRENALSAFLTSPASNAWGSILSNLSSNVTKLQAILGESRFTVSYPEWTITISDGTLPTVTYEDILNGNTEKYTTENVFTLCGAYTAATFPYYTISAKNRHNSISSLLVRYYSDNINFILSTAETAQATLSAIERTTLSYFTVLSGYSNARVAAGLSADAVSLVGASNSLSVPRNKVYSLLKILSDAVVDGGMFNTTSLNYYRGLDSNTFSPTDYVLDVFFNKNSVGSFTEFFAISSISTVDNNLYVYKRRVYDRPPSGLFSANIGGYSSNSGESLQDITIPYVESSISAMESQANRLYSNLLNATSEYGSLTLSLYAGQMSNNLSRLTASLAEVYTLFKSTLDEVISSNMLRRRNNFGWKYSVPRNLSFDTLSYYTSYMADPTYQTYVKNIRRHAGRITSMIPYIQPLVTYWNQYQDSVLACTQLSMSAAPVAFTVSTADVSFAAKKAAYETSRDRWFDYYGFRGAGAIPLSTLYSREGRDASFSVLSDAIEWARTYNPDETQRILSESYAIVNRFLELGPTVVSNLSVYKQRDISLIDYHMRLDISKELQTFTYPPVVYPTIQDLSDFSNVFAPYLSAISALLIDFNLSLSYLSSIFETAPFLDVISSANAVESAYIALRDVHRNGTYNGLTYKSIMDFHIPEYRSELAKAYERIETQEDSISRYITIYTNFSGISDIVLNLTEDGDGQNFVASIPPTHPDYWRTPPVLEEEEDVLYLQLISTVPSELKTILQSVSGIGYLSGLLNEDYLNLSYTTYLRSISYDNISYIRSMQYLLSAQTDYPSLSQFIKTYTKTQYYTATISETISDSDQINYPLYDNNWLYYEGDIVTYNKKVYQLYNTTPPTYFTISGIPPTNSEYWTPTSRRIQSYGDTNRGVNVWQTGRRVERNIYGRDSGLCFQEFHSLAYDVGEYVWYEGDLYRCISEYTTVGSSSFKQFVRKGIRYDIDVIIDFIGFTPRPPDPQYWALIDSTNLSIEEEHPVYSPTLSYYVGDTVLYPGVIEEEYFPGRTYSYTRRTNTMLAYTCKNRISEPIEYVYSSNYVNVSELSNITYAQTISSATRPSFNVSKRAGTNELIDVPRFGKSDYDPWSQVGFPRDLRYAMAYNPEKTYFRMIGLTCPDTTKRIHEYSRANDLPIKADNHSTIWHNLEVRQQTIISDLWLNGGQYYSTYRDVDYLTKLRDRIYTPIYDQLASLSSNADIFRKTINGTKADFFDRYYSTISDNYSNFINPRISQPSRNLYYYRDLGLGPLFNDPALEAPLNTKEWRDESEDSLKRLEDVITILMANARSLTGYDITQYLITGNCDFQLGGGFNCDYDLSNVIRTPYRLEKGRRAIPDFDPASVDTLSVNALSSGDVIRVPIEFTIPYDYEEGIAPWSPVIIPIVDYRTLMRDLPTSFWNGNPPGRARSSNAIVGFDSALKRIGAMTNDAYELPPYCYIGALRPVPKPPGSPFGRFVQRFAIGFMGVLLAGTIGILDVTGSVTNNLLGGLVSAPGREWNKRLAELSSSTPTEIADNDAAYPVFAIDQYLGTPKVAIESTEVHEYLERIRVEREFCEADTAEFKKWQAEKNRELKRLMVERIAINRQANNIVYPPIDPPSAGRNLIERVGGAAEDLRRIREMRNRLEDTIEQQRLRAPLEPGIEQPNLPDRPEAPEPPRDKYVLMANPPIHIQSSEIQYQLSMFRQQAGDNFNTYIKPILESKRVKRNYGEVLPNGKRGGDVDLNQTFTRAQLLDMRKLANDEIDEVNAKLEPHNTKIRQNVNSFGASRIRFGGRLGGPRTRIPEIPSVLYSVIFTEVRVQLPDVIIPQPPSRVVSQEWLNYQTARNVYLEEQRHYNMEFEDEMNRIEQINVERRNHYNQLKQQYDATMAALELELAGLKKDYSNALRKTIREAVQNAQIDKQNEAITQRNAELEEAYKAQLDARARAIENAKIVAARERKLLLLEEQAKRAEIEGRTKEARVIRKEIGVLESERRVFYHRTQAITSIAVFSANATLGSLGVQWDAAKSFGLGDLDPGIVNAINNIANEVLSEIGEAVVLSATRATSSVLIKAATWQLGRKGVIPVAQLIGRGFAPQAVSKLLTKIANKLGPLGIITCAFLGAWQSGAFDDPWRYQDPFKSYRA